MLVASVDFSAVLLVVWSSTEVTLGAMVSDNAHASYDKLRQRPFVAYTFCVPEPSENEANIASSSAVLTSPLRLGLHHRYLIPKRKVSC